MTHSKRRDRKRTPPAVRVRIVPHEPRKISPALPAAVPRVRAKRGKR
jgi:hypothetical protein